MYQAYLERALCSNREVVSLAEMSIGRAMVGDEWKKKDVGLASIKIWSLSK